MIYVANWKMNMHVSHALQFCNDHKNDLIALTEKVNAKIVLCPSFPALYPITEIFKKTAVLIGGQNCSEHHEGAYTGEVSAQSLAELGCTYCIIGHSERRTYFTETNTGIAYKMEELLDNNIIPILCIGENREDFEAGNTIQILKDQLKEPIALFKQRTDTKDKNLIIAYEPVWSIGTGIIPKEEYLVQTFLWMQRFFHKRLPNARVSFLYGGSVKPYNVAMLKKIPHVDGFLIGGASTDFQTLKKIVS